MRRCGRRRWPRRTARGARCSNSFAATNRQAVGCQGRNAKSIRYHGGRDEVSVPAAQAMAVDRQFADRVTRRFFRVTSTTRRRGELTSIPTSSPTARECRHGPLTSDARRRTCRIQAAITSLFDAIPSHCAANRSTVEGSGLALEPLTAGKRQRKGSRGLCLK